MSDWQPPDQGSDKFVPGEERAPVLRWLVGFLALAIVAGGAIWLVSKVVLPEKIPGKKPPLTQEASTTEPETPDTEKPQKPDTDAEAWVKALEKDTLEGYREYLKAFPKGDHAKDAQERINAYDNKAWATAQNRKTIAGYEDYLKDWPDGLHASKARELVKQMKDKLAAAKKDAAERAAREAADWAKAAGTNTVASYENYLRQHPAGKHEQDARDRIAALKASKADADAWAQAKAANTTSAYQQYVTSFPHGAHVAEAMAAMDRLRPKPGRTFKDCPDCPLMVSLPAGTATLGAARDDALARPNEKPARPVNFANMFAISVNEITFDDWQKCVNAGACPKINNDNGWGRGRRPVINVSWDEALKYTSWLSKISGFAYSLPSEAQWEYAARAGDTGVWIGGSKAALCAFANGASKETGLRWANTACTDPASDRTLPVGTLGPNKFGVRDIIGNVAEWTLDCNTLNLRDAPTDGRADQRGSCNQRVARGGSWFSGPNDLRYTARLILRRGDHNDFTGFRVVRKVGN